MMSVPFDLQVVGSEEGVHVAQDGVLEPFLDLVVVSFDLVAVPVANLVVVAPHSVAVADHDVACLGED